MFTTKRNENSNIYLNHHQLYFHGDLVQHILFLFIKVKFNEIVVNYKSSVKPRIFGSVAYEIISCRRK
jgi:hypothetical protein